MTHFQDNWTKSVLDTHIFISPLFESDHKICRKYHKNKMNKKAGKIKINIHRNTYQYIDITAQWRHHIITTSTVTVCESDCGIKRNCVTAR